MPRGRTPDKPWFRKSTGQWYMTLEGKQIALGKDKSAAKAEFYTRLLEHEKGDKEARQYTIEDVFIVWIADKTRNARPATVHKYRYFGNSFVEAYGGVRVSAIRPHHVIQWGSTKKWSQSTMHLAYSSIKAMLLWGLKAGYYQIDPLRTLVRPKMKREEIGFSLPRRMRSSLARKSRLCDRVQSAPTERCSARRTRDDARGELRLPESQSHRSWKERRTAGLAQCGMRGDSKTSCGGSPQRV